MANNTKKDALERLTRAREALADAGPADYENANREVIDAEKDVRLGRMRGWDYVEPEGN